MKGVLLVCLGGAVGSGLRYGIHLLLAWRWPTQAHAFPWSTLTVNALGCALAGLLVGWLNRAGFAHAAELQLLFVTGICGGFTTFSAFAVQSAELAPDRALLNIAVSVAGGLGLAWLGLRFGLRLGGG